MKKLFSNIISVLVRIRSFLLGSALTRITIGQFDLYAHRDHPIGRYMREQPNYGKNLPRIVGKMIEKYPNLAVVDIGANIGDTVALIRSQVDCPIICIEGDDFYFNLLKKNIAAIPDVHSFKYFLADRNGVVRSASERSRGTYSIAGGKRDMEITTITLDNFFQSNPQYREQAKVLKIDTDGYDTKIIRGGMEYIKKMHPVIFFELDRFLLSRADENGPDTLSQLKNIGYTRAIFYDNNGRFLLDANLADEKLIRELYQYTYRKSGAFPYYDVSVFHREDDDIAEAVITEETANLNRNAGTL